jgi:hypothetical protein
MSNDPGWLDLADFLDLHDVAEAPHRLESLEAQAMVDDGLSIVSLEDLMDD